MLLPRSAWTHREGENHLLRLPVFSVDQQEGDRVQAVGEVICDDGQRHGDADRGGQ
jgi:hypothetical protein